MSLVDQAPAIGALALAIGTFANQFRKDRRAEQREEREDDDAATERQTGWMRALAERDRELWQRLEAMLKERDEAIHHLEQELGAERSLRHKLEVRVQDLEIENADLRRRVNNEGGA